MKKKADKEIEVNAQAFLPKPFFFKNRSDMLSALGERKCGRFILPLSAKEHFQSMARSYVERHDPWQENTLVYAPGTVPWPWQLLAQYLFEKRIIPSPRFTFPNLPNDRPKFPRAQLPFSFDSALTDGRAVLSYRGTGAGFSFEEALSKAVGEALERYVFTLYKKNDLLFSSASALERGDRFVFPVSRHNRFSDWQRKAFPRLGAGEKSIIGWAKGEELLSGKEALIPAQLVFWNYEKEEKEAIIADSTTSGCGGHFSDEEAILSSLYENVERDGFMLRWLSGSPPPKIGVAEVADDRFQVLVGKLARYKLKPYFLDTTSDIGVPSVACVLVDISSLGPAVAMGSSTGYDTTLALTEALLEAILVSGAFDGGRGFDLPKGYRPFLHKGIGRAERLLLWKGKKMEKNFSFFLEGKEMPFCEFNARGKTFSSKKEELAHVLSVFGSLGRGYEVFCYRAKHAVLKTLGYHAVKTIIPKLFPLYLSEHLATLDSDRLAEVPKRLGWEVGIRPPWPHPFP